MRISSSPSQYAYSHAAAPPTKGLAAPVTEATEAARQVEDGDIITIATYNCENVFLEPVEGLHGKETPAKPEADLAAVGRVIQNTNADVVALQEIHDQEALDTLVDTYMPGASYPYRVLVPGNDPRGINVAIISKFPIVHVESNAADRFDIGSNKKGGFSRDFLETTIRVKDDYEFTIGTTHLKAHAGGQAADDKRLGEARQIHKILAEAMEAYPSKRYVVCGDFNDTETSPAVQTVLGKDDDAADLYDPLAGTDEVSHPVTHRRIDFMLLSEGMKESYVPDSQQIVNDPDALKGSDHLPVISQFRV